MLMIPFVDLSAQYRAIKPELDAAILEVLASSHYVLGAQVAAFEKEFAAYCESTHAIGVNSGTSALHLALLAAGVGPGDEVITVPLTFVATAAAISYTGARPVLVDVDPVSLTMDPAQLARAITPRTRAIVPVHLYGHPADMDPILDIARDWGLTVVEDACQAHGARYKGRRVGSFGDLACFSFYPSKNLGACGEGGMIVTRSAEHARALSVLRDHGQDVKYHHPVRGFNYRLEAIQAAALRVKLRHLDAWTEARRAHARRYEQALEGVAVATPAEAPSAEHVYHLYVIRAAERDRLQAHLAAQGIQTGIHYPIPVHLQPAFRDLGYREGDFPVSEVWARTILSLPMYPELTSAQIDEVADVVAEFGAAAAFSARDSELVGGSHRR
jgi:dTDP-4-amino-4,6-dideoxygalactose transaminase